MINSCKSSRKKQKTNDDSNSNSNSNTNSNSNSNIIESIKLIERVAHAVIAKKIRNENKIIKQSCEHCVTHERSCYVKFISTKCAYCAEIDRRINQCRMNHEDVMNMKQILKDDRARRSMNSKRELEINKLISNKNAFESTTITTEIIAISEIQFITTIITTIVTSKFTRTSINKTFKIILNTFETKTLTSQTQQLHSSFSQLFISSTNFTSQ